MPDLTTIVLRNGAWLLAPVMLWNALLASLLPPWFAREVFWRDIPPILAVPENVLRIALFALPCVTVFGVDTVDLPGYLVFVVGLAVYFASWLVMIRRPQSRWSRHLFGFLAPAYTPVLWLAGIALTTTSYVGHERAIRWAFLGLALGFLGFHLAHATLIHRRMSRLEGLKRA